MAKELAERAVPAQVILEFLGKVFDGRLQRVVGIAAQIAERRDRDHLAKVGEHMKVRLAEAVVPHGPEEHLDLPLHFQKLKPYGVRRGDSYITEGLADMKFRQGDIVAPPPSSASSVAALSGAPQAR